MVCVVCVVVLVCVGAWFNNACVLVVLYCVTFCGLLLCGTCCAGVCPVQMYVWFVFVI